MSGFDVSLAVSVFLAAAVEAVEAFTIVLAVGSTRSWRSALAGTAAATILLAGLIATVGSALVSLPVDTLRTFVGGFLLLFGLQWLRKAILRSAGTIALHDENVAYAREAQAARAAGSGASGFDGYSLAIAFKAVFLEGVEVALIVITVGAGQARLKLAALAAAASVVVVVGVGLAVRAPLARVPENTMKLAVGVLLSSFGIFWATEGAGASWPAGEAFLPVLVTTVLVASLLAADGLRRRTGALASAPRGGRRPIPGALSFLIGDDSWTVLGVIGALGLTAALASSEINAWYLTLLVALGLLWWSLIRGIRESS